VEEEEDAGSVAVLAGSGEEEDIVVLDEHVGDASVVVDHRRVHLGIALRIPRQLSARSHGHRDRTAARGTRARSVGRLPPCRGAW
jgi:hypothetical protein